MSNECAQKGVKDWHSSKQIGKRARYLLEHPDEQIPSDVTFLVGDGKDEPQKMFKCHKFILAMVSSMFQAMFYGPFPQTEDLIKVPDVTPTAFQHMLRYAYGEKVDLGDTCLETAMDILYCAKKYLIAKLTRSCRDHILFHIAALEDDPCVVLQRAPQMDEDDLATLALTRIGICTPDIMQGGALLRLSFDCLKTVVDYAHLGANEACIYQGVCRWVKHNVGAVTGSALRSAFGSMLYSIRFPLFGAAELADGPATDDVLTSDEVISIFKFLFAKVKPAVPFLTTPRTPLPPPLRCFFHLVTGPGPVRRFLRGTRTRFLYILPDLAPECCAFLRKLVEDDLHIKIAGFDNEHVGNTVPLPAGLAAERNILSHTIKSACWFAWDVEDGTACNVRICVAGKTSLYRSAVFGFVRAVNVQGYWVPFNSWSDRRIQGVEDFHFAFTP